MGTGYDCSDVKSHTAARTITPAQRRWRNRLVAAMAQAGLCELFEGVVALFPAGRRRARPMISRSQPRRTRFRGNPMTQPSFATHEVFNQSPPFEDVDLFAADRPLREAVAANGGGADGGRCPSSGSTGARPRWSIGRAHRQREPAEAADLRRERQSPRRRRVSPGLSRASWRSSARPGLHDSTWNADGTPAGGAGRSRARRALLHGRRRSRTGTCARSP